MQLVSEFSGIYSQNELVCYLKQLREVFQKSSKPTPIAIQLNSLDHAISIVLDPEKKC